MRGNLDPCTKQTRRGGDQRIHQAIPFGISTHVSINAISKGNPRSGEDGGERRGRTKKEKTSGGETDARRHPRVSLASLCTPLDRKNPKKGGKKVFKGGTERIKGERIVQFRENDKKNRGETFNEVKRGGHFYYKGYKTKKAN